MIFSYIIQLIMTYNNKTIYYATDALLVVAYLFV